MDGLEKKLNDFFLNKLPEMPQNAKEMAVKAVPWVLIVFGILGLLVWLSSISFLFGLSGLLAYSPGYTVPGVLMTISFLLAPIIQVMAVYGGYLMRTRQLRGWRFAFYALLFGLVTHICSFSIIGILLDAVFAYLLFQIKAYFA